MPAPRKHIHSVGPARTMVTGAPGWLGTALVSALRGRGREVVCLVRPGAEARELRRLGAEIVPCDLRDPDSVRGCCDAVGTVFHCAGVIHSLGVREMWRTNAGGTTNLVEEACRAGVGRFVHVSSSSAAGANKSRNRPMDERDPARPGCAYGRSKLAAETAVLAACRRGRLPATVIRPCWFYGPGQPARQTGFMSMIGTGRPLIFGDGRNLRSLSRVDSVVEALLLAESRDAAVGRVYWIADRRPYPVIEIYETIATLLGVRRLRPMRLPVAASRSMGIASAAAERLGIHVKEAHVAAELAMDITCNVDLAVEELGWTPPEDLSQGMRLAIDRCRAEGRLP